MAILVRGMSLCESEQVARGLPWILGAEYIRSDSGHVAMLLEQGA